MWAVPREMAVLPERRSRRGVWRDALEGGIAFGNCKREVCFLPVVAALLDTERVRYHPAYGIRIQRFTLRTKSEFRVPLLPFTLKPNHTVLFI